MNEKYSARQVADMLNVHKATVLHWINRGELKANCESKKYGYIIEKSDLDDFIQRNPYYQTRTAVEVLEYRNRDIMPRLNTLIRELEDDIAELEDKLSELKKIRNLIKSEDRAS